MKEIDHPINTPNQCTNCKGEKVIRKSDCCHAPIKILADEYPHIKWCGQCRNECHAIISPCPNCNDQTQEIANG